MNRDPYDSALYQLHFLILVVKDENNKKRTNSN